MSNKYQTSFQYSLEEKRMGFFKIFFVTLIIVIGAAATYAYMIPSEKRPNWFNVGVEKTNYYYTNSVLYVSNYIPAVGEWTGIKPVNKIITRDAPKAAPLKPVGEKIKVYRSNQTEQTQ